MLSTLATCEYVTEDDPYGVGTEKIIRADCPESDDEFNQPLTMTLVDGGLQVSYQGESSPVALPDGDAWQFEVTNSGLRSSADGDKTWNLEQRFEVNLSYDE
jgi:hypothetical protein